MTEPMENHPSLSKHVVEFLLVAKEYVSFSETPQHFQQSNYIDTCLKLFSMLYLKALLTSTLFNRQFCKCQILNII